MMRILTTCMVLFGLVEFYCATAVNAQCPDDVVRMELINPSSGPNIGLEPHGIWTDPMFCGNDFNYFYILPNSYLDIYVDGSGAELNGSVRLIRGGNCLSNPNDTFYFHVSFITADSAGLTLSGKDNYPGGLPDPNVINDWLFYVANDDDSYMYNGTDTLWMPHFFGHNPSVAKYGLQVGQNANGKSFSFGMAWWFEFDNGVYSGLGDFSTELDTVCVPAAPTVALCPDQEIVKGLPIPDFAQVVSTVNGGVPPFSYSWTNTNAVTADIEVSPNATTTYQLTVTDALNRSAQATHTVTVHNISAGNGKVYMCDNKNKPKTKSVDTSDVAKKLGEGYSLGSCDSSFNFDGGTCGEFVPPVAYGPCDCEGKIKELTIIYTGPSNVDIEVLDDKGHSFSSQLVFTNVQSGDTIVAKSTDAGQPRFDSKTFFDVIGTSVYEEIHTSCSQDILGEHFGPFFVLGHIDFNNNQCGTSFTPPPPPVCDCEGKIKELTIIYSGPSNVDIEVLNDKGHSFSPQLIFSNVQSGDTIVAKSSDVNKPRFDSKTFFEVLGTSVYEEIHTSCSQDILGEHFGPFFVLGHIDFNNNQCGTSFTPPPPPVCDCEGKIKELTIIYTGPSNVDIEVLDDKGHSFSPQLIFSNVQSGDTIVAKSTDAGQPRFDSKTFFEVLGTSVYEEIHTSCSQDILGEHFGPFFVLGHIDFNNNQCGTSFTPPPPTPCACEDKMKEVTVVYTGPSNVDVEILDDKGHSFSPQLIFSNVQTGDTLVVLSSAVNMDRFKSKTFFTVVGTSVDEEIHTSCSREILGDSFGPFTVIGHVDFHNHVCGTSNTPPPPPVCDCEGKIKELTIIYTGPSNVDIEVLDDKGHSFSPQLIFSNVRSGDTIVAKSTDAGQPRFDSKTFFEVLGTSVYEEIHTSCSQDILGLQFGPFFVAGHTDYNNNTCQVPSNFCVPGVTRFELVNPSQGLNIGLQPHANWAANLFCDNTNVTYFYVLPGSYIDLNQDGSGAVMHGTAQVVAGDQCLPTSEQDAIWNFYVRFYDPADSGYTLAGKDNYPGGIPDTSVKSTWIHLIADNSQSYMYKGTDTIFMPHYYGTRPDTIRYGFQLGQNATGKNLSFGFAWWYTYSNGGRSGVGDFSAELDTVCVGEPIPPSPPLGPCDCEGRIKELTVIYSGPDGVDIQAVSLHGHSSSTNATLFTNVQDGDTLTALASDAGLARFGTNVDFLVSGNSNLDQSIHTSCSQDILGNTYGAFYVQAHTDYNNNYCNADINPMMVKDDNSMKTGLANNLEGGYASPFADVVDKLEKEQQPENETTTGHRLVVYPNPFNNLVQVSFYNERTSGTAILKVMDPLGKVVINEKIINTDAWVQRTIEINGKAGLYILSIENGQGLQISRLIKY